MGNGCCHSNVRIVVPHILNPEATDCAGLLVSRSRARHFLVEGVDGEHSSASSASELGQAGGECMLLLERASYVPHSTARPSCNPFVCAWAEDGGKQIGQKATWPAKPGSVVLAWYTARSLRFQIARHRSAVLRLEFRDQRSLFGELAIPLSSLPGHYQVTRELEATSGCAVTVSFQILDSHAVMGRRTVFFVRHAESKWNVAQSKMHLREMARTTDHPLSSEGCAQAEQLSDRLAEAAQQRDTDAEAMLQPDVVYVSPLTRAVQTAVIALGPLIARPQGRGELVLMANARERQSLGGMDTRSKRTGADILRRVFEELRALYRGREHDRRTLEVFQQLRFDADEVQDHWWCEGAKESDKQLHIRLKEFMSQLLYTTHRTIIVVGHSHFFRAVFKQFMSDELREARPKVARDVSSMKLMNCGVARVELDPRRGLADGPIVGAELILGSRVVAVRGPRSHSRSVTPTPDRYQGAPSADEGDLSPRRPFTPPVERFARSPSTDERSSTKSPAGDAVHTLSSATTESLTSAALAPQREDTKALTCPRLHIPVHQAVAEQDAIVVSLPGAAPLTPPGHRPCEGQRGGHGTAGTT